MKGEHIAKLELLLRSHPEGLRRAEIARRLGVHRSTISRYVEDLSKHIDIYEDNRLIKIKERANEETTPLELSIYEGLAFNMSVEALTNLSELQNPHLASALRKIAMNMNSYAPRVAENILSIAEEIDLKIRDLGTASNQYTEVIEVLIDCWMTGRIARVITTIAGSEEIEIAPYFIGFTDDGKGRIPMTVTGRLRHTKNIITINISKIKSVQMLNETYTIPDHLKPFNIAKDSDNSFYDVIDMVTLKLEIKERSALNSFSTIIHKSPIITEENGKTLCTLDAENSIELMLRIIQCGTSIKILEPKNYREKLLSYMKSIMELYN